MSKDKDDAEKRGTSLIGKMTAIDPNEVFDEDNFLDDVRISYEDLKTEIVEHSVRYWKYGKLHRIALFLADTGEHHIGALQRELKETEAEAAEEYRQGGEKLSVDAIKHKVAGNHNVQDAEQAIQEARLDQIDKDFTVSILDLAEKIFSKRSDLLKALGYMKAAEFESDVKIMGNAEARQQITKLHDEAVDVIKKKRSSKANRGRKGDK